jgi:hypothetical protein
MSSHKDSFTASGTSPTTDFRCENHGSIFLLFPRTELLFVEAESNVNALKLGAANMAWCFDVRKTCGGLNRLHVPTGQTRSPAQGGHAPAANFTGEGRFLAPRPANLSHNIG